MLYTLDKWKRVDFCTWALKQIQGNILFATKIIFTDESVFYLNGTVNRQTTRFWAQKNPQLIANFKLVKDKKIMVWLGVWNQNIIGKFDHAHI